MTERPILFNPWKVRAIHDGATQTRRPVNPQPTWFETTHHLADVQRKYKSPFGVPGDLLVPLTTWSVHADLDDFKPRQLPVKEPIWSYWSGCDNPAENGKRRPGRFLPLFLRGQLPRLLVKRVWVERVQSITDADVVAEGIRGDTYHQELGCEKADPRSARIYFADLWDTIYGDKFPWAANWPVWCCEFGKAARVGETGDAGE